MRLSLVMPTSLSIRGAGSRGGVRRWRQPTRVRRPRRPYLIPTDLYRRTTPMICPRRFAAIAFAMFLAAAVSSATQAQTLPPINSRDSVTIRASDKYEKGAIHRFFFGDNYRDIWSTPVKAPVLDLSDFAGGLKPTEIGGGKQTRSLRFQGANGRRYVFRPLYKALLDLPDSFRGTIIWNLVMDARSASHPTAPVSPPPVLAAVGVLHSQTALVAMPDDARLGEFRKEFARVLGTIEEGPEAPEEKDRKSVV